MMKIQYHRFLAREYFMYMVPYCHGCGVDIIPWPAAAVLNSHPLMHQSVLETCNPSDSSSRAMCPPIQLHACDYAVTGVNTTINYVTVVMSSSRTRSIHGTERIKARAQRWCVNVGVHWLSNFLAESTRGTRALVIFLFNYLKNHVCKCVKI
jgi:hypothetical protein